MTTRNNLTVEKMNRAIEIINTYLSSDISIVIHDSGINYLLKDIYHNMFNYIFLPVLKEFSEEVKLYFKYITIVFYQPPKLADKTSTYDVTYYFTYYYLKLSLIFLKRVVSEFKLKTLTDINKDIQLITQLGIHFIFEVIYNNYRHDDVEKYIQLMTNPKPDNDFWRSIICGYLIETLIGLYGKDSFVIIHINGGPDIIDVENMENIKYFEVKSSAGGDYGCNSFFKKNRYDLSRLYDCLSIEHISRLDDDTVLRFHIQVNKMENDTPISYICDNIKTIDINTVRLNESINTCNKHLNYIFTSLMSFKGRKISIDLSGIQIKYKIDGYKLKANQVLLNNICIHTWSYKTKSLDKERKNRISYSKIGNTGSLPETITENIRTEIQSKNLLETEHLDGGQMIFNINSIEPKDDPTYYPNYNESGTFVVPRKSETVPPTPPTFAVVRGPPVVQRVPVVPSAPSAPSAPVVSQVEEIINIIRQIRVAPPSLDLVDLFISQNQTSIKNKLQLYMINIANIIYPAHIDLKKLFINEINKNIIHLHPQTDLVLLHVYINLINLNQQGYQLQPNEVIYIIIILMQIISMKPLSNEIFSLLSQNAKYIILSYKPNLLVKPYINGTQLVINVNGIIYSMYI